MFEFLITKEVRTADGVVFTLVPQDDAQLSGEILMKTDTATAYRIGDRLVTDFSQGSDSPITPTLEERVTALELVVLDLTLGGI